MYRTYNYGRPLMNGGVVVKPPSYKLLGFISVIFIISTLVFAFLYFRCGDDKIKIFGKKNKNKSSQDGGESGRDRDDDLPVSENADIDLEDDEDFMPRNKNFSFHNDPGAMMPPSGIPYNGPPPPMSNSQGPPPPIQVGREATDNKFDYDEPGGNPHDTMTGPRPAGARRKGASIRL